MTSKPIIVPMKIVETAERKRIAASKDAGYEVPVPILNPFSVTDRHLANFAKAGNFFPTVKTDDPNPASVYRGMSGSEILRKLVDKADADGRQYNWGRV